jgi:hypothetical protein
MGERLKRKRFDEGVSTVEFALLTLVAAALAGGLLMVVRGADVTAALKDVILRALG